MAQRKTTPLSQPSRRLPMGLWLGVGRGLAAFFGGFSLLNLAGEIRHAGFDANLWWIDLHPLPPWAARVLLAWAGTLLLVYALRPDGRRWRHHATMAAVATLLAFALANALGFHLLVARGAIGGGCPLAFSWLVAAGLTVVLVQLWGQSRPIRERATSTEYGAMALTVGTCLAGFPLAQMCCFGLTDYRRPADAAVVFGARVYANGQPSLALADRVQAGCALYRDGLVGKVIFSGGPGDGATHETEAMRRLALELGVAPDDILIDEHGVNTEATARNSCAIFERHGINRVLAVSHFYHLPRIKLTYQRYGWEVCTVPARQTRWLVRMPHYMAREIAALWVYYLRPLAPSAAGRPGDQEASSAGTSNSALATHRAKYGLAAPVR